MDSVTGEGITPKAARRQDRRLARSDGGGDGVPGNDFTFAKEETLVQAMMHCIGDKSVTGWLHLQKFAIA
jgi:hypothetical protein